MGPQRISAAALTVGYASRAMKPVPRRWTIDAMRLLSPSLDGLLDRGFMGSLGLVDIDRERFRSRPSPTRARHKIAGRLKLGFVYTVGDHRFKGC